MSITDFRNSSIHYCQHSGKEDLAIGQVHIKILL